MNGLESNGGILGRTNLQERYHDVEKQTIVLGKDVERILDTLEKKVDISDMKREFAERDLSKIRAQAGYLLVWVVAGLSIVADVALAVFLGS